MTERNMLLRFLSSVVFLIVAGCSSTSVTLTKEDRAQLNNQTEIGAVHHEPAAFYADAGVYGLVGHGKSLSAGKEIRTKYRLEDPAAAVKTSFLQALEKEYGGIKVRAVDRAVAADDLGAVKKAHAGPWIIDFKTLGWGSAIEGDVEFTIRARLIRNDDSRIVWQGTCKYETKRGKSKLLTGDSPALLKAKFQAGVAPCVKDLWSQFQAGR
ncbi:MAG: hypothetical protein ACREQP_19250 [Candidatus Binatia bacterium]